MLCFGAASLVVLVSKLAFLGWGIGSARLNFTGFSGHTMLSAAVWPVALWLVASRATHRTRVALAVLGWALAAGSASRAWRCMRIPGPRWRAATSWA